MHNFTGNETLGGEIYIVIVSALMPAICSGAIDMLLPI